MVGRLLKAKNVSEILHKASKTFLSITVILPNKNFPGVSGS